MPARSPSPPTRPPSTFLLPLIGPALLALGVALLVFLAPIERITGVAYIPLVFCSLWFARAEAAFVLAFAATALGLGVFFMEHAGDKESWITHANHIIIFGAVWLTATLIYLLQSKERELTRYTQELERSNQELDDFAYIASHDLKEPLRGLFNNAKFLEQDFHEKLDETGLGRLHRMGYLSQRMENLINDLLYFSRLGRQELAVQPTELNAVINEIASMMEATFKEQNVKLIIPRPLPTILCDRTRVTEL